MKAFISGTYEIVSGDFDNGKITLNTDTEYELNSDEDGLDEDTVNESTTVTITSGVFTSTEFPGYTIEGGYTFTKQ